MEEGLDIPKWIEKIMTLWLKDAAKPLPKELRDVWRDVHKRKAEELREIDREKLTGWQRAWVEWLLEANEMASEDEMEVEIDESEDVPAWYEKVSLEVMHAYAPTINFRAVMQKRPSQTMAITCGEWVGHEYMIWCRQKEGSTPEFKGIPDEQRTAFIALMEHFGPQRLKLVDKALAIANKQPIKESRQFFRGYYLALDKGTFNEMTRGLFESIEPPRVKLKYWSRSWPVNPGIQSNFERCYPSSIDFVASVS